MMTTKRRLGRQTERDGRAEITRENDDHPRTALFGRPRRMLLSGNEAMAQGAWEAGVLVACGYPGTPSTEIIETLARFPEVDCEWSTNEKVALEVAVGACFAGGRALAAMKHVGLNVAADPFFSVSYTGCNGGLVVVSADDPGMHSSQNEQDNRILAYAARVPILEPSTPQEAKDYTAAAFGLSETFDVPVLIRTTTRIAHGKGPVEVGLRKVVARRLYHKLPSKYVLLPAHSRLKHAHIETVRIPQLRIEAAKWIQTFEGSDALAFITAGAAFFYVREAFPNASVMKLGMTHPLPQREILAFAKNKKRIVVVEELEPFMEQEILALGISAEGKSCLPRYGELSVNLLRSAIDRDGPPQPPREVPPLPARPPVMCAGCSHRGTFYALKRLDAIVAGDIGCYTLGALAPLEAMDSSLNMGASIAMAHGMEKVMSVDERKRLVAVIGDSTFFHSGLTGLVDVLYNEGHTTTIILDNHTTAMTGHQAHPGSGTRITGDPARRIDIVALCRSIGIDSVCRADPYDLLSMWRTIDEALHRETPSVIVADAPCAIKVRPGFGEPVALNLNQCTQCLACVQVGCPAIEIREDHLTVNPLLCVACGYCRQVCSDCNAGIDIPLILELTHQKRYREAFGVVLRASPFPAVSARVCPHPCDHDVNALGHHQERIRAERYPDLVRDFPTPGTPSKLSVREVERFLGDYGIDNFTGAELTPSRERAGTVAIVGAGPSGLSAAWRLRCLGYSVAVFESLPKPGGMMRYGIPELRLPRAVLDAELNRLSMIGIAFHCGVEVGKDVAFSELAQGYDAIVLAVGKSAPQRLRLDGARDIREGLLYGIDFLRRFNRGLSVEIGGKVAVIGGGNTAIDCARCGKKLGAEVTVYYRRDENDMPALREEIDAAVKEGIRFEYRTSPKRVVSRNGAATGLVLTHRCPGPPDGSGGRYFEEVPDDEFEAQVSQVILAVGEQADVGFLKGTGIAHDNGLNVTFMGATLEAGVFACGDAAFGHGTVTQAISTGRRVAKAVEAFLQQREVLGSAPSTT